MNFWAHYLEGWSPSFITEVGTYILGILLEKEPVSGILDPSPHLGTHGSELWILYLEALAPWFHYK